jgi:cyclic pyranopterin phosphate synthase
MRPLTPSPLQDPLQRHLNYLRVSITDRCNLRCCYCAPGGILDKLPHAAILRYEEILRLVRVGAGLGISKVRVTGGEPLVRRGVVSFLAALGRQPGLTDVSLTTNGVLLERHLEGLAAAGVRRLNISLDTLDRDKYRRITGGDYFPAVWRAVLAALGAGFHPIKLNVVVMRGINDDEVPRLAALSRDLPVHVRFIEFMPMGCAQEHAARFLSNQEVRRRVETLGALSPAGDAGEKGPAERWRLADGRGEIGFISPISHHFCGRCNRLRLTASGRLRACLLSDRELDLKALLRGGGSDADLAEVFQAAARAKPAGHDLQAPSHDAIHSPMCRIGG